MLRAISRLSRSCSVVQPSLHRTVATSFSEVTVPVPWGHISGKWWGDQNKQPILAVHGWLDNAATFDRLAPYLLPDLPILAIDLPGHGQSSYLPRGTYYHWLEYLIVLRRVVKHFGWSKVSLMGHSLGSGICFVYSSFYAAEVERVALLDVLVPVPAPEKGVFSKGGKILDKFIERDGYKWGESPVYPYEKLIKLVVDAMQGSVTEETAKILLERGACRDPSGNYRLTSDPRLKDIRLSAFNYTDALELASGLKTNVLCVKADSSPYYMPKEWFYNAWENVKKAAISADLRMVPGKHHVHLQNPEIVAPIICDFFNKNISR